MVYGDKLETYLVEKPHPFESDILCNNLNGLEPGWLGVSFGLRNSYVRIIMTRYMILYNLCKI